jgi:hypothetical protein
MSLKRKSFLLLLVLILSLALILPGCITASFETKINPDGSGERIQDLAVDEAFIGALESSATLRGKGSIEDELKKNMPKDAKYKKFTKDGKIHYQIIFDFKDVDELNRINKKLNKDSDTPKSVEAKLSKTDFLVIATYKYTDEFPKSKSKMKSENEQLARAFSVSYKLTLPGKITKANTDEVENNTATWHISPVEGGKIKATSRYIKWPLIIVIAVALLLIVIILGILIFFSLRKKKPATPEQQQTPEQQT